MMKLSKDELIQIISDVTSLLGHALAQHVELNETLVGAGAGVKAQQKKLQSLQSKLARERARLAKLKDAAKRKRDLEKLKMRNRRHGHHCSRSQMLTCRALASAFNS